MSLDENMASSSNGIPTSLFFHPNFIHPLHDEQNPTMNSLNPLFPSSNPHDFSRGMVAMMGRRSVTFSGNAEGEDDLSDESSQPGEKKRRLNMEQVRTLEKSFELGNKIEPERKIQLSRALGLQPRQIAIWFQNRRARWKTKQLEKDFDLLKRKFDAIKADNDSLQSQNKKLQAEILALKCRERSELINLNKEIEGSCSNRSEHSSEINLDIPRPLTDQLNHIQSISFFPAIRPLPTISQFLHGSSTRPELPEENLGNLLCGMEDQNTFWSWHDQPNFH
ncbi:hypothetical protein KFK09_019496 [Dendrobium nobile]|uniref:Homeobox-leucine zipper protein n=1 Tax=Dendrobium nobile TaxID=94219 RepID=A0A8T3APM7_DENNO|nr:hypothetical protein KFK09_019496 [Dendrobium nobile]